MVANVKNAVVAGRWFELLGTNVVLPGSSAGRKTGVGVKLYEFSIDRSRAPICSRLAHWAQAQAAPFSLPPPPPQGVTENIGMRHF